MLVQEIRKPIQKMYSQLDYYKFCEYLGLNPEYDMEYWKMFQQLAGSISAFDDKRLQKIFNYGVIAEKQEMTNENSDV